MKKEDLIRNLRNQKFPDNIIKAFSNVKREDFLPEKLKSNAYEDTALPIGYRQTISQPYTIAFMLSLLKPNTEKNYKILEIGSGSGYVLALINQIMPKSEIYGIERIKELAEKSREVLSGKGNIKIIHKDGSKGLKEQAPFDRILVSAAFREIPHHLIQQLKIGGVLVAPVRNSIIFMQRFRNETKIREFPGFVFVPVIEG